jgi:serine-type D-Ala-D-Ala carboxypeptidase/endopeptidase
MRSLSVAFISICFASAFSSTIAADLKPVLDPLLEPILKDKPAAGIVVGIWTDGKPQVFGYGKVTTPDGESEPRGDTIFEIGSITKAFTGTLLAEAVLRKELALDDTANKHLPADIAIRSKPDKPVTVLHLATHRSGLPVQPPFIGVLARNKLNPYADFTRAKLAKMMADLTPTRDPDVKYEYSNLGVGLLGHALVNAAKASSFDALVQQRICLGLGMSDTSESLTGGQKARLARGHTKKMEPTDPWDFASLEACGGLRSTTNDLLKFAAANIGELGDWQPQIDLSHKKQATADTDRIEIGFCWHRLKLKSGEQVVWHNGGTGGFRSMLAFTPKTRRAVVVLCAADLGAEIDRLALSALVAIQPK